MWWSSNYKITLKEGLIANKINKITWHSSMVHQITFLTSMDKENKDFFQGCC